MVIPDLEKAEDGMWCQKRIKSSATERPIPVPNIIAKLTRDIPGYDSIMVFPNKEGKAYSEKGLEGIWKRAQRDVGFTPVNVYQLRHFWMNEMRKRGVVGAPRARLGGQESGEIAETFYDQFSREELRAIAENK
jgi:hypothetical protein